jgi:hypothetical protein
VQSRVRCSVLFLFLLLCNKRCYPPDLKLACPGSSRDGLKSWAAMATARMEQDRESSRQKDEPPRCNGRALGQGGGASPKPDYIST